LPFAQLGASKGNQAVLLSIIGTHPLTALLREDLQGQGVILADLAPERISPPPVSSIMVTSATGDRAVVASNAVDMQAQANQVSPDILDAVDIVLIDGHQMAVSAQIAEWARSKDILVVVDGGSWKPNFDRVLPYADVVVASANFHPPGCSTPVAVFDYLKGLGVSRIAITQGASPILYEGPNGSGEIDIPKVRAVDTLGAGDIFHGAFCHFYLTHTFEEALLKASRSASFACQYWGTRDWTKIYRLDDILSESDDADDAPDA